MLTYSDYLHACLDNSEYSLRKLSIKCSEYGVHVSASYISQIKNGKLPPATEKVNRALATACNYKDVDSLVLSGYLDKMPSSVRKILERVEE